MHGMENIKSIFLSYQSGLSYIKLLNLIDITYLHTASTNCCPTETPWFTGARNSLLSYFDLIHRSFSSRLELGVGLARPRGLHSHMLLARVFPIDSITLKCPGLKTTQINSLTQCIRFNSLHTKCQYEPLLYSDHTRPWGQITFPGMTHRQCTVQLAPITRSTAGRKKRMLIQQPLTQRSLWHLLEVFNKCMEKPD